ncbi:MAG: helix-turn-helix domain-containing protein [Bdellovibrionota bacterium]
MRDGREDARDGVTTMGNRFGSSNKREAKAEKAPVEAPASFRKQVRLFEIEVVEDALRLNNFNESQTARYLKMDRNTLRRIRARARQQRRNDEKSGG